MSDHDQSHDENGHAEDHGSHGGLGIYMGVFFALCILTGASFFTYSSYWPFKDTPAVGWAFMMAVSCTKALLVMLFFMHLLYEANWKYVLTLPCIFMSIFLLLMLVPDVGLRMKNASRERMLNVATPEHVKFYVEHLHDQHADQEHGGHDSAHKETHQENHGDQEGSEKEPETESKTDPSVTPGAETGEKGAAAGTQDDKPAAETAVPSATTSSN